MTKNIYIGITLIIIFIGGVVFFARDSGNENRQRRNDHRDRTENIDNDDSSDSSDSTENTNGEEPQNNNGAVMPTIDSNILGQAGCFLEDIGLVPITEFAGGTYKGYEGGLYPDGSNTMPEELQKIGLKTASNVVPRDINGSPSSNGLIGVASIGMSNTNIEFGNLFGMIENDSSVSSAIRLVNGAQGSNPITDWGPTPRDDRAPWDGFAKKVEKAGLTPEQVQVVWIKHALRQNASEGEFPEHAETFQDLMAYVAERVVDEYPNVQQIYVSSRTRAYSTDTAVNSPEPYAYELGFGVKWFVEDFINGEVDVPFVAWGPYLWANGESGPQRSDGFVWNCEDTRSIPESLGRGGGEREADFMHPSEAFGGPKIGAELLDFFSTADTTKSWFLK